MRGLVRVMPQLLLLCVVAAGCGKREPTLVLTTVPPDAVVAVEGFAHPGGSPHEIVFKEPGRFKLSVSRDGFRPVEMFVTLKSKQRLEQSVELVADGVQIATDPMIPGPIEPIPYPQPLNPFPGQGSYQLRVSSSPNGADVVVREPGSPDSRHIGRTPLAATLPDGRPTEVVISMPGYKEHKRLVFAPQGGGDVSLDVVLSRKQSPGPGSIDIPDPLVQIDPPIDTGSYGFLSVNANPWCAVHVDGKAMGNTPLVQVKVKAGYHTVLLENRDLGHRRKRSVQVRPGEHIRIVESFD